MSKEQEDLEKVESHYEEGVEEERLETGHRKLERVRIEEMLDRFLPDPPAVVRDVGGGPGYYAAHLARKNYEVHLVDIVPLHIEQARERSEQQPDHPIASMQEGDARNLNWENNSSDAVLLLGPLYHLQEKEDRKQALEEAYRVLKPGGVLMATAISRFASALDGLVREFWEQPEFEEIVRKDMKTGEHENPEDEDIYFTKSYFHRPDELRSEVAEAGFDVRFILGIEGPAWMMKDFDEKWKSEHWREVFQKVARLLEDEEHALGTSVHFMLVANK